MIIDANITLGTSRFGMELAEGVALERCAHEGVTVAVVNPSHPVDHDFLRANEELAGTVERAKGRLVGLCRVDPWDGDVGLQLLHSSVDSLGFRGLFLHPAEEHFRINDSRIVPLAKLAAELDIPVVVATGYPWLSEPSQVADFAQWCPDVPVIMTNGGQYNISGLSQIDAESALGLANIHLYTSGVYREDFLQKVVKNFGPERVLFASSAPYFDPGFEKRRVDLLHVSEGEREALLRRNAQRVFWIDDNVVDA